VAIAADIASFPPSPPGLQGNEREAAGLGEGGAEKVRARRRDNPMRRHCVAVIQRVCVITAKVTLTNVMVTDFRKVLESLLGRCVLFLTEGGVIIPTHSSTGAAVPSITAPCTSSTPTFSLPLQYPSTASVVSSSYSSSPPRGVVVDELLVHYRALEAMKSKERGIFRRKGLSSIAESNARKAIRTIQERYN
jgi:hypothetical protein